MNQGVRKVKPDRRDYSFLHTYAGSTEGLPDTFSIYDGRPIPDQRTYDRRFNPPLRPGPMACTGETQTFIAGLEDGALYDPMDFYDATPPGVDGIGRDVRQSLKTAVERGFKRADGVRGFNRAAYFHVYGSGKIDDFDAMRIALWMHQNSKRGISLVTYFYQEMLPDQFGNIQLPTFNTKEATLHNYLITGWRKRNGVEELECIPWLGMESGDKGKMYIPRPIFNKLINQPYTGAFILINEDSTLPITLGWVALWNHLVAFIRQLYLNL